MASGAIKILFVIDYFHRTGGTERHLTQLIAGLPREVFSCSLAAFDLGSNKLLDDLREQGVSILSFPVGREYVPNALVQAWRLSKLIRSNEYQIVQTFHQKADTFGALVAWVSGVKHIVSSKRDTGELRRPWHLFVNRRLQGFFDAFVVVAEAVRAAVIANDHLPARRIRTIYNGVDPVRFHVPSVDERKTARARLGFRAEDFVVGVVASFRPEKNHEVLFEGASRALKAIPSLRILSLGAGPLYEKCRDWCERSALRDRVTFTGDVSDVVSYLWAMDVGVLPSGSNEGLSNAVLEQMSVGLPMIVTDVGGNGEAVADGSNGIVVAPLNAAELSTALIELSSDGPRREAMGRESRKRVEQKFTVEKMCEQHVNLYLSLISRAL